MKSPTHKMEDLAPYTEQIAGMLAEGRTLFYIAAAIERSYGVSLSSVSVGKFIRRRDLRPEREPSPAARRNRRNDYNPQGSAKDLNEDDVLGWLLQSLTVSQMSDITAHSGARVSVSSLQRYITALDLREQCRAIARMGAAADYVKPVKATPPELLPGTVKLERQSVKRYRHPSRECYLCGTSFEMRVLCGLCVEGVDIPHDRQHHDPGYIQRRKLMERTA